MADMRLEWSYQKVGGEEEAGSCKLPKFHEGERLEAGS